MKHTKFYAACISTLLCISTATPALADPGVSVSDSVSRIHFITLSTPGDAILLESNGHFGMIDSGEDSESPDGSDPRYPLRPETYVGEGSEEHVIDYMRRVGVTSENLDFYIGTHPHSDHIGSADEVIREFSPERVYLMEYKDEYISDSRYLFDNLFVYDEAVQAAQEAGSILIQYFDPEAPVLPEDTGEAAVYAEPDPTEDDRSYTYFNGAELAERYGESPELLELPEEGIPLLDSEDPNSTVYKTPADKTGSPFFDLGDMHLEIVNYSDDYKTHSKLDANLFSLGVKVTMDDGYSAFLSGDIVSTDGDEERLASTLGHVDLMKLGHHGIANANSLDYLAALSPEMIIQTGNYSVLPLDRIHFFQQNNIRFYSMFGAYQALDAMVVDMKTLESNVSDLNPVYYERKTSPLISRYENGLLLPYTGREEINGNMYYFDNSPFISQDAWYLYDENYYFADEVGLPHTGWLDYISRKYYLDENGIMQTGFVTMDNGDTYYFHPDGHMESEKWVWSRENYYYIQPNGVVAKDQWIGDYYVDENGIWIQGMEPPEKWVKDAHGWRFVYADGSYQTNTWFKYKNLWYYLGPDGYRDTGWQKIDGKWFYLNGDGVMQRGWIALSGKWFYLNDNGVMQTGWQNLDNRWYYLHSSGVMMKGWFQVSGKWFYTNGSGVMQKGWIKLGNTFYYLNANGVMQTGWQNISGKWYYLNDSGAMQKGWLRLDGKWFYLNSSGAMVTGWLKSGSTYYYLNANGVMQTGRQNINGKWYTFDSSGRLLP